MTEESAEEVTIRPLVAADRAALARLPERVSRRGAIMRFHGALTALSEPLLDRLLDLEPGQREAVAALDGNGIVGVARFVRDDDPTGAEFAILVADEWHHRGVATRLLHTLIDSARQVGMTRLHGEVLAENDAARSLVRSLSPVVTEHYSDGHIVMTVDLTAS